MRAVVALGLIAVMLVLPSPRAEAACSGNAIACENLLPGTPASVWDIDGRGDDSIQGFATQVSVNAGSPIQFKIDTDARAYTIKIFRLGYYQGLGARQVATINPSAALPQVQPPCATDATTQIYDCGTWNVSASWTVPTAAVSGVYIASLVRTDTGGGSHIPFVVRSDGNTSKVLFQTSDPTWQAYNTYGGSNFYYGGPNGRSFKASYNRPYSTRDIGTGRDFLFANEYPMIRFLEQNGMDVSYVSGQDTSVDPNLITKHKAFLSVGHDEYWSADQRKNVTDARDAKVNLAFFGGNDVYWKTSYEPSQDGTNTPNRTLVCYKDTWANFRIDRPGTDVNPTWRDPRFGDLGFGPENSLMGTQYQANSTDLALKVDSNEGALRLWRNTSLAGMAPGTTATLAAHTVGYESDEDVDNGFRPAGLVRMSTTTGPTPEYLTDFGNTVVSGTTTHHITLYKAASGALVFGAGTVQWAWGLDSNHDGLDVQPADPRIRQATLNLLTDMGAVATTLASDLSPAVASTDATPPTSTITQPAAGSTSRSGDVVTVKGTATDAGGGVVGAVEVSVDGGATFHPADGRGSFTYTDVLTGTGPEAIQVRATDDSGNQQPVPTKLAVTASCPCSIFGAMSPITPSVSDGGAMTLGTKFTAAQNGFISGIRFYKGDGNTGAHTGTLYDSAGSVLATAAFSGETSSGWQTVNFSASVPVTAGTTYIAGYYAPNGHYAADTRFFAYHGYTSGALTALGGNNNPNGVYGYGTQRPTESFNQTNYYVDAVWSATDDTPLSVTSAKPLGDSTSVPTDTSLAATFSRAATGSSVNFSLVDDTTTTDVAGSTRYDADSKTATFTPDQGLAPGTRYTAWVSGVASSGGGMPAPYRWSFVTAKAPGPAGACPCTVFDETDQPTSPAPTDTSAVQVGMAFTSSNPGTITGVRFFKEAANSGAHTVSLWNTGGTRLATAPVTDESTSGWQQANFASPVTIAAGTTYIASYLAPNGRYSATSNGLSSKITRDPLATEAPGGRYVYGGTAAPLTKSSANYFVDPVFETSPGQAPTVFSTAPDDGATSVPVTAQVTASFDGNVQPGSAVIEVKRASDGTLVPGNLANETAGATATFTPSGALDAGTKYTVTVSGARSSAGTPMAASYRSSFTTSGAGVCPCSLLDTSTVPALSDAGDSSATTLGLKFSPTVDGYVKGLRYYRDAANTGTHSGSLWTSDGDRKATVTFDDSGTGWQTATFSAPVRVTAGTTYVAGYYAPNGHYSASTGYFRSPVSNVPLVSVDPGGVYANGNGFPDQTYLSTNYYVDVVFTTSDDDPPTVGAVAPASGATEVTTTAAVTATFNNDITPGSLAMTLTDEAGQLVGGQASYDPATRRATFTSAAALVGGATYKASVSADSASGVSMPAAKTWTFTTTDVEPAAVSNVSPNDSAVSVPAGNPVNVTFVKTIDPASLTLSLRSSDGVVVSGTTTYDAPNRTATFTPGVALASYTAYTATVNAASPSGVAMTQPKSWTFTTADTIAPVVSSSVPVANATGASTSGAVTATFARAIDPSSLAMTLATEAGVSVSGTTTYAASTRVATFTPKSALAGSTAYRASVSAVNPSGVAMSSPATWSFTTAGTTAPAVTSTSPAAGAREVAKTAVITATFAQPIDPASLSMSLKKTTAGTAVAGTTTWDGATNVATFTPSVALADILNYTASVSASSVSGTPMAAAKTWTFTTTDGTAPTVTSTIPTNLATNVATKAVVTATFAQPIDPTSVQLTLKAGGVAVAGTVAYDATTRKATLTPSTALAEATSHTASITAKNRSGVAMTTPKTWSFTTADTAAPTLSAKTPAADATNVAAGTNVTATFAKAITTGTLAITLKTAGGATVPGATSYNATTRTATFNPTADLTSSTAYTASVNATSSSGVPMASPTTWTFTTAAQSFSLYATTRTPSTSAVSTTTPTTVGVKFSSSRAGSVTAIRYYANSVNTGRTVKLWAPDGSQLGTATTNQTGTGWRTATFSTPVAITAGTTYTASYYAPVGRWSTTPGSYTSAFASGPLTVSASGGVSSTGDVRPTTASTTNYWVDVVVSI